ncbi:MAG: right-handed parallel beta-helix repeat-containing protein, partial [Archaeoglobaceae archaeon]|nr:right-handed parallel beta-helix repeat-containing protein [Archaeoglobaceae archaeon]
LSRSGTAFYISGKNWTVKNSTFAFSNVGFASSYSRSGKLINVIGFENHPAFGEGRNFETYESFRDLTLSICVSAKAHYGAILSSIGEMFSVEDCTFEENEYGIWINTNHSFVSRSLIRNNLGVGIIVSNFKGEDVKEPVFNITITKNSIYNNSRLGIDLVDSDQLEIALRGDNVTLNDGLLNCSQPNCGMDYPVISYAEFDEMSQRLYVEGFIGNESVGGSAAFANAKVEIYLVRNSTSGDNLIGNNWTFNNLLDKHYGEGYIYLGEIYANSAGYFEGEIDVSGKGVDANSIISAIAILNGNTSEFGPNSLVRKRLNLSAEIDVKGLNATLKVKAFEKARNVKVYWIKPFGISVTSMSGDYDESGGVGNFYWWKFREIDTSETKSVYLNLTAIGSFSLSEAFNLGLDPEKF